jgi:hypothetical protein
MKDKYEAPEVRELGSISELTESFDKIGSAADFLTPTIPQLDGDFETDK